MLTKAGLAISFGARKEITSLQRMKGSQEGQTVKTLSDGLSAKSQETL